MNIEVDVLAKMVERSLAGVYDAAAKSSSDATVVALSAKVTQLEETVRSMQTTLDALMKK